MLSVCWSFARHIVREHSLLVPFRSNGRVALLRYALRDGPVSRVSLGFKYSNSVCLFFVLLLSVRAVGSLTAAGVWFR